MSQTRTMARRLTYTQLNRHRSRIGTERTGSGRPSSRRIGATERTGIRSRAVTGAHRTELWLIPARGRAGQVTAVRQRAGHGARALRWLLLAMVTGGDLGAGAPAASAAGGFQVGAATADITPPLYSTASDSAFVPTCGTSPAQVAQLWPGKRLFEFEKPYVDLYGLGRYAPGTPTATPITPGATRLPTSPEGADRTTGQRRSTPETGSRPRRW